MAEKSPNLTKDINLQIQESERTTNKASQKYTCISIPKHITIKLLKTKDKKKKSRYSSEKNGTTYRRKIIWMRVDSSSEAI